MAVDAREADRERFVAEDPGGPLVTMNLLRFAEGGRATYLQYVAELVATVLPRYGAEVVYAGDGSTALIAEEGQAWDAVLLLRYPDRSAFARLAADPDFQRISALRSAALTDTVLQATTPWSL